MISEETLRIARSTAEELRLRGEHDRAQAIETLLDAAREEAIPALDLLTSTQAGDLLGVSGQTIKNWVRQGRITAYRVDADAGLKPAQTLSTLPPDFKGQNTTAEVKVHPGGRFVWVSNRGHESLAGFRIDPTTGQLSALGQTPTEKTPRSFDIEPDGRYVFGAGEGSGKLAVFRVDLDKGTLTRLHTYPVGKSLTWVLAVKMPGK